MYFQNISIPCLEQTILSKLFPISVLRFETHILLGLPLLEGHALLVTKEVVADHGDDGDGGPHQVTLLPLGQQHHGGHSDVATPALSADHDLLWIHIPLVTILMDVLTQKYGDEFLLNRGLVTFKAS